MHKSRTATVSNTVDDPGFPKGGSNAKGGVESTYYSANFSRKLQGVRQPIISKIFAENCIKIKEFGRNTPPHPTPPRIRQWTARKGRKLGGGHGSQISQSRFPTEFLFS